MDDLFSAAHNGADDDGPADVMIRLGVTMPVEDGLTGILVDTSRPDALATAVTRALAMAVDAEAGTHADAARARVRERFGIDAIASQPRMQMPHATASTSHRRVQTLCSATRNSS